VTIVTIDSDAAPSGANDRANVGGATFPANAVADCKKSGFVAGHLTRLITLADTIISYFASNGFNPF
jgi:hypothetical protein